MLQSEFMTHLARKGVLREAQGADGGNICRDGLADLLALDVIVLGSLATYLGEPWLQRVRAAYRNVTRKGSLERLKK